MAPPVWNVQRTVPVDASRARTAPSVPPKKISSTAVTGAVAGSGTLGVNVHFNDTFSGRSTQEYAVPRLLARRVYQSDFLTPKSSSPRRRVSFLSSRSDSLTFAAKSNEPADSRAITPTSVRLQSHIHGPQ